MPFPLHRKFRGLVPRGTLAVSGHCLRPLTVDNFHLPIFDEVLSRRGKARPRRHGQRRSRLRMAEEITQFAFCHDRHSINRPTPPGR